jgi:hypothetical protein
MRTTVVEKPCTHTVQTGRVAQKGKVYLADLKSQTDNLRLLLASVEAELSQKREQAELTDSTAAWLYALRKRLAALEEDTKESISARRQLVKLLVAGITVGKRPEDGQTEVRITYRPSPPPGGGGAQAGGESSVGGLRNGSRS